MAFAEMTIAVLTIAALTTAEQAIAKLTTAKPAIAGLAIVKPTLARLTMDMTMVDLAMARQRDTLVPGNDGQTMPARWRMGATGPDQGVGKDCWTLAGNS
jgi:hypothetical protein